MLINAKLIYITLRWICLMYVFPIGYAVVLLTYKGWFRGQSGAWKLVFAFSSKLSLPLAIVAAIWFFLAVTLVTSFYAGEFFKWRKKLADNIPEDDPKIIRVYQNVCRELGVSAKRLKLNRNVTVNMPVTVGCLRPQLLLPENDYTEEELKLVFYHELSHHKHGDLKYKTLAMFATLIHCYNPAAIYVFRMINFWSECMADVSALEVYGSVRHPKPYFDGIMRLLPNGEEEREEESPFVSAVKKDDDLFQRRVDFMRKYSGIKGAGKIITAAFAVVFALGSVSTAYASAKTIADFHSSFYQGVEDAENVSEGLELEVGKSYVAEDGTAVYYVPVSELDMDGMLEVTTPDDDIMPSAAGDHYNFNWYVESNTRHVSGEISVSRGQTIYTSVTVSPGDKIFWLGIMDDDGHAWYVESRGSASHNFNISTTNRYRVFVQNNYTDGTTLHAVGSFYYE